MVLKHLSLMIVSGISLLAQPCKSPTDPDISTIKQFIKVWYKLQPSTLLNLIDDKNIDRGCYRKLVFAPAYLPLY